MLELADRLELDLEFLRAFTWALHAKPFELLHKNDQLRWQECHQASTWIHIYGYYPPSRPTYMPLTTLFSTQTTGTTSAVRTTVCLSMADEAVWHPLAWQASHQQTRSPKESVSLLQPQMMHKRLSVSSAMLNPPGLGSSHSAQEGRAPKLLYVHIAQVHAATIASGCLGDTVLDEAAACVDATG